MPHEITADDDTEAARAALRQVVMTAFCDMLHESRLAPMTVMALAAEALGSIYQEVADAHRHEDACPCGWRPSLERDIEALQVAVARTARPAPVTDLRLARVAGRA
jgi:hypothetical protein